MRVVRIVIRLVGVAALLALLVYLLLGGGQPLAQGSAAPGVQARLPDGRVGALKLAGGKPTVVNFWATWCPPCLQEMPELVRTHEKFKGRVHFVGLAAQSDHAKVTQLVERLGISFDVAEVSGQTTHDWNVTAFPSTFIVDGDGKIAWSTRGPIDEALLTKRLDQVLAKE